MAPGAATSSSSKDIACCCPRTCSCSEPLPGEESARGLGDEAGSLFAVATTQLCGEQSLLSPHPLVCSPMPLHQDPTKCGPERLRAFPAIPAARSPLSDSPIDTRHDLTSTPQRTKLTPTPFKQSVGGVEARETVLETSSRAMNVSSFSRFSLPHRATHVTI